MDMCIYMCMETCMDMCTDRTDMCMDMCIDMCLDTRHVLRHVLRHVSRHVYRHAYRHHPNLSAATVSNEAGGEVIDEMGGLSIRHTRNRHRRWNTDHKAPTMKY